MTASREPMEILLVEDNCGDVRLVKEAFTETTIETVFHVTTDGNEALEFLFKRANDETTRCPDLVLLDLNLPRKDGHEVLAEIRDHSKVSHLPVLILSSSRAPEDVRESYELTANAYLTKPTDPDEFVSLAQVVEDFWLKRVELPPLPV